MLDGKIEQIYHISGRLLKDCSRIADMAGGNAEYIFNQIKIDINDNHELMLAHSINNKLSGFIKGRREKLPCYIADEYPNLITSKIDWLYVDADFWRMGIGGGLLKAYADYEKDHGVDLLFLRSLPDRHVLRFYKNCGFKTIGWNYLLGRRLRR
ncbi:MAG: GNAT family N-acetyltransferase [Rickettsiales bacterium]|jgi:GNAT superfamily N-acetyltransferase|nr:GNAT family N-acetyltransferase [Rickettsiales bacterium]